jgi:plasmid stabilization system protein ParE
MSDYVLGSDAVLDLEDIWDYIAADNVVAADRWAAKLFDAFEGIARMPGIGHRREELTAYPVLFWTVGAYLIIYRAEEHRPVEIVAVTQGSRDIPSLLRRRFR